MGRNFSTCNVHFGYLLLLLPVLAQQLPHWPSSAPPSRCSAVQSCDCQLKGSNKLHHHWLLLQAQVKQGWHLQLPSQPQHNNGLSIGCYSKHKYLEAMAAPTAATASQPPSPTTVSPSAAIASPSAPMGSPPPAAAAAVAATAKYSPSSVTSSVHQFEVTHSHGSVFNQFQVKSRSCSRCAWLWQGSVLFHL